MQRAYLVVDRDTSVAEFLERRSIMEVVEEHRSLSEIDLEHQGIVDVDRFIYIYYGSNDEGLTFRTDLNILRQLLRSAFFHADSAIFILVNCTDPMLEDLIIAGCKDTVFQGSNLEIIHHDGNLVRNDVVKYLTGEVFGEESKSSYKTVYIRESDSEERNRYAEVDESIEKILPTLTDQWGMYRRRASVEALSSSTIYANVQQRPQIYDDFLPQVNEDSHSFNSIILSGEKYTKFCIGADYLVKYFMRVGIRPLIIDMTTVMSSKIDIDGAKSLTVMDIQNSVGFAEHSAVLKCTPSQFGFVVEMLSNVRGVGIYIIVCDRSEFITVSELMKILCDKCYNCFTTHYYEEALKDFISGRLSVDCLFLSTASIYNDFNLSVYKEDLSNTRVALFESGGIDYTAFYESIVGAEVSVGAR